MDIIGSTGIDPENYLTCLVEQYGESLLRMCHVYLRDADLAEDAVQETFMKAYKALEQFRSQSSEKTWLMRIAINTCKDMRRSAWHRYVDRRITIEHLPTPAYFPTLEQSELVIEIMKLPQKHKDVVLLYYYQGMTIIEISQVLKVPNQTVSARLQSARKKLKISLEGGQNDA